MTVPQDDSPIPPAPPVGLVLDGRYRLEARIGGGGMGAVYQGRHLMMDQVVAIKVLRPELARDPATVKRFAREAKSTFRFDHPHCVRVTDFGASPEGFLYLVMEYLRGRTLSQELSIDGPMAPHRAVHVAGQVCAALGRAHALGFVHRDLKPDNVMLLHRDGDPDFVKVLDFGLAKLLAPEALGTAAISFSPLTGQGAVFGTPAYMSPEQAMDQPLAPSTDIYALGVTLYEMLTGEVPFAGTSFMEVAVKHVEEAAVPPRARRPDLAIPEALDSLIMECLAKQPTARPQTVEALAERLAVLARALAPARVRPEVAASETIDLDTRIVAAAETGIATAMTTSSARPVVPARPPAERTRTAPAAGRTARRWTWARVLPALLLAGSVAAAALLGARMLDRATPADAPPAGGRGDLPAPAAPAAAPVLSPPAPPAPPAHALPRPVANDGDTGAEPTAPAPAAGNATPATAPARASTGRRSRARDRHLADAEAARRQGNRLKQMAEADSALRIDPDSRQGAFLLGDALLHTGDEATACKYLHRARRLARARELWRRAGCAGD